MGGTRIKAKETNFLTGILGGTAATKQTITDHLLFPQIRY
jgi:hypothetical protein